jgi:hypothetical protein
LNRVGMRQRLLSTRSKGIFCCELPMAYLLD